MSQTQKLLHWKMFERLKAWFVESKRPLPWRDDPSPYSVWVSEVMLQQTQVKTVIPYFYRWMDLFPTIEKLAEAPLEKVIKLWEGLGYYSRARNLHEGARYLMNHHGGVLPGDPAQLAKIRGLGPYSIGAILNFAFHQKAPAVDGNVRRVLARLFGGQEVDVMTLLPDEEFWVVSEALIELGALICTKKPECQKCPLQQSCIANEKGLQLELPLKKERAKTIVLHRTVGVIRWGESYLLKKGKKSKIMADLYEFPFLEGREGPNRARNKLEKQLGISLKYTTSLTSQQHSFTRYRAHLYPMVFEAESKNSSPSWKDREELADLPFSAGHRKILQELLIENHSTH